jgi:hypothetical protein
MTLRAEPRDESEKSKFYVTKSKDSAWRSEDLAVALLYSPWSLCMGGSVHFKGLKKQRHGNRCLVSSFAYNALFLD